MNSEEYKRQNERRDEQRKAKILDRKLAEERLALSKGWKTWFKWWANPSDRFAALLFLSTAALVVVSFFQLKAMRHADEAINDQLKESRTQNENTRAQIRARITAEAVSVATASVGDDFV